MKTHELRNLVKQLLALVLAFSLVAGMQPAIAKAAEEQKTITNIALATADDVESYTFYNGFNDNWYMAPGTTLVITYSDGSKRTFVVADGPLVKAETNSSGVAMTVGYSSPYYYDVSAGDENASWYAEQQLPFSITYDDKTNKVSAKAGERTFTLYTPQYKNLSEMKTLSLSNRVKVDGTRYMRFYYVTGPTGKAYETKSVSINEDWYGQGRLDCYKKDGTYIRDIDYDSAYRFTEDDPVYIIGIRCRNGYQTLHTELWTEEYNPLKQISIISPKTVWPQFEACTTDYQLIWEDGTESKVDSIYATSSGFVRRDRGTEDAYVRDYFRTHYTKQEDAVYGLSCQDKTCETVFSAFPSDTKVCLMGKGNTTNELVYTAGEKIALKAKETKMLYMNIPEGHYVLSSNRYGISVTLYSFEKEERVTLRYGRPKVLSGEYGILLTNTADRTANFRLLNLDDAEQVGQLPVYKPGQEVRLNAYEYAWYRFEGSSNYSLTRTNEYGEYISVDAITPDGKKYLRYNDDNSIDGSICLCFMTWHEESRGGTCILRDKVYSENNVTGKAQKEEWVVLEGDEPVATIPPEEQQKPVPTQATPVPHVMPTMPPDVNNKKTSIKGETVTVSQVTFKATSDSEASLNQVKKVKTITSYKVPQTITIKGNKVKVTTIDSNAFKGAKKLKKVTIASNVKTIKANAFTNCKKLKTVIVENANVKIKKNAFKGCKTITFKVKKSQVKKFSKMLKKAKIGCKYKVKKK